MAYNRYMGNGRVVRMTEGPARQPTPPMAPVRPPRPAPAPSGSTSLPGLLEGLLGRLKSPRLDSEDILLCLVLYLAWRESGDTELLIILAAMLFL